MKAYKLGKFKLKKDIFLGIHRFHINITKNIKSHKMQKKKKNNQIKILIFKISSKMIY